MIGAEIYGHIESLMETHWEVKGNMGGTHWEPKKNEKKSFPQHKFIEKDS
jgi:hypothetical protein